MQTAQRIISGYRRRRFILCAAFATLVLLLTLGIHYVNQRSLNEQRTAQFSQRAIKALENILAPLDHVRNDVMPLVGAPCRDVQLRLRQHVARMQTLRSIALVKNGVLYCSSIFGARHVAIHRLQPRLPSATPLLLLSTDRSLLKGTAVLIAWQPSAGNREHGVMQVINIEMLAGLMLVPEPPWISRAILNVGGSHLEYDPQSFDKAAAAPELSSHETRSRFYPFSIITLGPSAGRLALAHLPAQLPLALILALLSGYLAWLATASRMSFSREINLGLTLREFEVLCQPLLGCASLECVGVELLLRWNNPRQGEISPDVFIPLAEQQGLIAPLTRFVIDEAARHRELFPPSSAFHIGINVAASHLHSGEIINDLKRYWFPCRPRQRLVLELTERDALPDVDLRVAHELRQLGVELAIDDFGTGQSSLAYLEKLHPEVLKIDKSFTAAIGTDAVNSTVTDIIIALGQRLGIALVAEGVETPQQADYLRSHGVTALQGYLYARPMPLAAFPHWLENCSLQPSRQRDHPLSATPLR